MNRMSISVDKEKCIGCFACVVACKLAHNLPPHEIAIPIDNLIGPKPIRLLEIGPKVLDNEVIEYYFDAVYCHHCNDPPCIKECPTSAIYIGENNITLVDKELCTGCKICFDVCPFNAPQFNVDDKLILCDLCIDRLLDDKEPKCITVCPAQAITLINK